MKKILALGALALSVALVSEQQASAWINWKFGIGLNWSWQSGGNNFLWGAFRNGQPPGPEVGYPGHQPPPGYPGGHPGTFPYPPPQSGPHDFQYFGQQPNQDGQGGNAPAAQQAPAGQMNNQISWNGNSLYQPVSYNPNPHYYYNNSMYYYPTPSYYGGYAAPSYWYGR